MLQLNIYKEKYSKISKEFTLWNAVKAAWELWEQNLFYSAGLVMFVHAFIFLQHHRLFILILDMF